MDDKARKGDGPATWAYSTNPVRFDSVDGERSLEIEAMANTGASYTIVPAKLLKELKVAPIDTIGLVLADGSTVEYDIGRAMATIDG